MLDLDPIRERHRAAYGSAATPLDVMRDVAALIAEVERQRARIEDARGEHIASPRAGGPCKTFEALNGDDE